MVVAKQATWKALFSGVPIEDILKAADWQAPTGSSQVLDHGQYGINA